MIFRALSPERLALWRERLLQTHTIRSFDRLAQSIRAFSPGDRAIFYVLAILMSIAAIMGLYALEQSILVTVPAYGGTLTEGTVGSPRFINPLLAISDADRDLAVLTYAGLMGLSGQGSLTPVLAENYSVSLDGKVYTFTLRKDAKFSDGSPVTSADVLYTVQKAQDPGLKSHEYANWSGVGAFAVDAHTVRFTLAKPYAPFLSLTTLGILPARLWQNIGNEEFPFSALQMKPVGAGPFVVSSVSRDASGLVQSVTLEANAQYVLGRPYLNGIVFNFYSRSEDLARAQTSGAIESAHDIAALGARTVSYARVFGVFFNPNEKQILARAEVRKALSLAIDRQEIVDVIFGGYANAIAGPIPPGSSVKQTPVPKNDSATAAAADIMQSAGWAYDGVARMWKNAGIKQSLDAITIRTSNVPELRSVAGAVKKDWEKLGIPVTIELYEPGDLSQNVIRPRKYEALLYGMVIGRNQDLYAFWSSQERNDPGLNISLYANKTVDALLDEARTSPDARVRTTNLQKIEDTVSADYPAAFIYSPAFIYAVPGDLSGVELPQMVTPSDRFASVATWYRSTDKVWPLFAR